MALGKIKTVCSSFDGIYLDNKSCFLEAGLNDAIITDSDQIIKYMFTVKQLVTGRAST